MKKLSILGLVLMGASAVTAAILPSKAAAFDEGADNATLQNSTNGGQTCIPDLTNNFSCNVTVGAATTTTGAQGNSYTGELQDQQTQGNTSITNDAGTSVVL